MSPRPPTSALEALIEALRCLPGVGPKSAQRMAYHLLQHDRTGARRLTQDLALALERIGHCESCHNFSEAPLCDTCRSTQRDPRQLCVVETPADLVRLEQTQAYRGLYFVLMGSLSPLDGIGPEALGFEQLVARVGRGGVEEVILATNLTAEGDATAHAIAILLRPSGVRVSRLARGVPVGGELEFVDSGTLAQALVDRRPAL